MNKLNNLKLNNVEPIIFKHNSNNKKIPNNKLFSQLSNKTMIKGNLR